VAVEVEELPVLKHLHVVLAAASSAKFRHTAWSGQRKERASITGAVVNRSHDADSIK
jgi:hypothetical protein